MNWNESKDEHLTRHRGGTGEPLLLIHGLGLTWRCWTPVLPALEAAHDTIAIDLPGFGAAAALDGGRQTVGALADAVEAELARLGLDAVYVAGNSLGGWVALELARRGRARSVVAIAPSGLELPAERALVITLNEAMRAQAKVAAPVAGAATAEGFGRTALLGTLHGRPWRVPASEAAAELRAFAHAPGFQSTLRWTTGAEVPVGLHTIDVPVRVCVGTRDGLLGAHTAPRFVAAIPDAELHRLPGCGHVPMADDPALVADAIAGFTAR